MAQMTQIVSECNIYGYICICGICEICEKERLTMTWLSQIAQMTQIFLSAESMGIYVHLRNLRDLREIKSDCDMALADSADDADFSECNIYGYICASAESAKSARNKE